MKALSLLLVVSVFCVPAGASMLTLTKTVPDITSDHITVKYVASTHTFTASGGWAEYMDVDGIAPPDDYIIPDGTFSITASIGASGQILAGGGTLTIGGTIAALGATSGTLLTGTLASFGYADPPGGSTFEFIFDLTGGDLKTRFGGGKVGVILGASGAGFNGTFTSDFGPVSGKMTDTFPIPEPATAGLLVIGGIMTVLRRFRARQIS